MSKAKPATINEVAASLADLDFNVSDEEKNLAKQLWLESVNSTENYSQIKDASHPM